ncbi:hypothetical protein ABG067_006696 [Albugo candida]
MNITTAYKNSFSVIPMRSKRNVCAVRKVIFLGDRNVGKTSLLLSMVSGKGVVDAAKSELIGTDYLYKVAECNQQVPIKVQLWDSAGQDRHGPEGLSRTYLRHAHGAVLVYDVTDRQSMLKVFQWTSTLLREYQNQPFTLLLVANKTDCPRCKRIITTEEGQRIAYGIGAQYVECSATNAALTQNAFNRLAENLNSSHIWRQNGLRVVTALWLASINSKVCPLGSFHTRSQSNLRDDMPVPYARRHSINCPEMVTKVPSRLMKFARTSPPKVLGTNLFSFFRHDYCNLLS